MAVNLFDAHFYRTNNADLAGFNDTQALQHFQAFGLNEGRIFSPFVNLNFYRSSNNDLANFNNQQAFEHLQTFGIAEGRSFSPLVDLNFYRGINNDLVSLNNQQIFEHLRTFGITEDRDFSPFVDLGFYRVNNSDLGTLGLGFDNRQLLEHLEVFGIGEGRRFSVSFDSNFYRTVNADLAAANLNNAQLLEHFELFGLNEGRASSQNFDVSFYLANNPDLTAAGFNNQQALQHFEIAGFREGRLTAPPGSGLPLPTEIGNTLNTAFNVGVLGNGGNFNIGERVDSVDKDDFYRFTLASNSSLSLSLSNLSDDAVLSLVLDRNANGQINANEEFDITLRDRRLNPANPNIETINLTRTLGAGTYFIHVATSFPEDNTEYTLNVSANTAPSSFNTREPGNELRTNFDLGTLGSDRSFTDFVGFFDTNDFYRFNLDSTTTFSLSLISDYINSAFVELIWDGNSNGQIEAAERFASASTIFLIPSEEQPTLDPEQPNLEPPAPIPPTNAFPASGGISATLGAGTYFIRVAPGFDGANTNYTLNLSVPPAPVTTPRDPGSTLSTSVEIPGLVSERIFTDFVGFVDTIDIYRFSLDVTSNFNLSLEGDALVDLIADSNSNGLVDSGEVFTSSFGEEIISTLGAGTYFIRVTPASSRSNTNYNLNVSATPAPITPPSNPGSTLPTALNIGTLSSNRSFTDFVGVLNPNDFYRFNLASTSNFSFSFSEDLSDIALAQLILDSNGNGLVENGEVFASSSGEAVTRTLGVGNYFIRVAPTTNSANTNYTLNLSATSVPITTPSEPGNTLPTAFNIGTLSSSSFTDFVGSFDRNDFYRFNLASASIFNVSLSDQLVTDTALLQLILDINNNGLVDNGEVFASSPGTAIASTLGTGNYFVRVAPGDNTANTNYTLNLSATPVPIITPPTDPGNTLSTALDIGTLSSSSFTDFVGSFDTNDFYRFNLDGLSNLNASLSDQLVSNSALIELIFDNNGNNQIDPGETINSSNLGINLSLLEGSYFIRIAPGNNSANTNYTLNLVAASFTTMG